MPEVYGFTAEQMGRVVDAVEAVEGQRPTQGAAAPGPRPQAAPLHHVKVTSTTLSSGFYPGTIQLYDASTQTWSDGATVNFLSSNGDAPILNRLYLARAVGIYASDGKPIYARDVLAGGGGSLAVNTTNNGTGDTTVTNAAVTTIQIDQASGLKEVSGGGTVTLSVQAATSTHAGTVTTANQTWVGIKILGTTGAGIAGAIGFNDNAVNVTAFDNTVGGGWRAHSGNTGFPYSGLAFTAGTTATNRDWVLFTSAGSLDGTTWIAFNKGGLLWYDGTSPNFGQTTTIGYKKTDGTNGTMIFHGGGLFGFS